MEALLGSIEGPALPLRQAFARLASGAGLPWLHRSETINARVPIVGPAARSSGRLDFERQILPQLDAAYSFARFLARDADAAHDIVQEAFLRAYRAYDGFRGGEPRAWLLSIVRNCHRDWHAARRRVGRFEVDALDGGDRGEDAEIPEAVSDEDGPEDVLLRKSEAERVRDVLATLPPPLREMLVLRELEDLSYREIAMVTDLPIGTVMSRLARARSVFAQAWRRVGGEPQP